MGQRFSQAPVKGPRPQCFQSCPGILFFRIIEPTTSEFEFHNVSFLEKYMLPLLILSLIFSS